MNNLAPKIIRFTQVLHYSFLTALIVLVITRRMEEFAYHQELLLLSKVLGGLLIIAIAVEILISKATQGKKLQWLSSVIVPQLIASVYLQELWLLAIALSALIFVNVIRKKLYLVEQ